MSVLIQLKDLIKHMHWADAKIWHIVLSIPEAQKHEKLKSVLYHLHITQYAFYFIWLDLPQEFPKISEFESTYKLADWAAKYPELLKSFSSGLKDKDLNRAINIPWSIRIEKLLGKKPSDTNLAETMLQVITHSSYHRGQVNSLIRILGVDPPQTDFIAWIWLGKPSAVWPQAT
jgi:uncharacterized damage-inducible protein DinB